MSSDKRNKRVINSYDVEEVRPQPPDNDSTVSEPGQSHRGKTTTEGLDKMMEDLSSMDKKKSADEPVSGSDDDVSLASFDPDSNGHSPRYDPTPDTAHLERDLDWIGVQLVKLNMARMARRAFEGRMDSTEIDEVALQAIYSNKFDASAELDLQPAEPGSAEFVPAPVPEEEIEEHKERLTTE